LNNSNLNKKFKKAMKKNKGNKKNQIFIIIIFFVIYIFTNFKDIYGINNLENNKNNDNNNTSIELTGNMEVYFLDVGQGDATYINVNGYDILIDAGPKSNHEDLLKQLEDKNIDDFEIVIATHPHEDHIGGMTYVLNNYKVENFYMPKVTHTTKTFENMISSINSQGLSINVIKEGDYISLGEGAYIEVFSPMNEEYDNLNNYSPVMKLTYGNTSFMLTGDAESESELEVVEKYGDKLKSDVLSFGHHGSSTSSSIEFIEAVNPTYGVISVGADNSYGHPHRKILDIINKYNIETLRTDINGEIKVTSDGENIIFTTSK